ncbi:hypothetical protein [Neobacillus niacini]|uniref:hypothetical protein n=1 Tax=Neobacillus niacini TaxID=86668 RepID=UPI00203AB958|nr:hypothetical protein [Neobacillus niacini]MCM3690936.1 hypothetical protein [Neobacillus niacini]
MSALKKEDIFNELDELQKFIKSLSSDDKEAFANKINKIKEKVQQLLNDEEDRLYNGIVNKSLEEVWDNEKDDAYNEL